MNEVRNLEPKSVWNHFEDLNAVPRPSKKEERVIAFMKKFGEDLQLETIVDELGNVIIKKPATPGMENRETIVIQGHLDMVHQKNADTNFDFDTQGIQSYIDGEWVKAKGTTLGADNGMGVAAAMAILSSDDIKHPAVEALFTIDEETGMTGAIGLKGGLLSGGIMLNLDTEEDHELTIGCAGGINTNVSMSYKEDELSSDLTLYTIEVKGLLGGHSGMDIHRGRGNANKLMNRLLLGANAKFGLRVAEINGGGLRNAIPRESVAVVAVKDVVGFEAHLNELSEVMKAELHSVEKGLTISWEKKGDAQKVMSLDVQEKLLKAISAVHNGVFRMSADMEDLVETSSSLASISVKDGEFKSQSLQRSSVDTQKIEAADSVRPVFELMGATVVYSGKYPGWTPKPEAPIVKIMSDLYRDMFNDEPFVNACHAGLECGILGTNYPEMEMISFGPTIRGAHSPDERVNIKSVGKFWNLLLKTLENIPVSAN